MKRNNIFTLSKYYRLYTPTPLERYVEVLTPSTLCDSKVIVDVITFSKVMRE